mgnify:CR=1 FL=1
MWNRLSTRTLAARSGPPLTLTSGNSAPQIDAETGDSLGGSQPTGRGETAGCSVFPQQTWPGRPSQVPFPKVPFPRPGYPLLRLRLGAARQPAVLNYGYPQAISCDRKWSTPGGSTSRSALPSWASLVLKGEISLSLGQTAKQIEGAGPRAEQGPASPGGASHVQE